MIQICQNLSKKPENSQISTQKNIDYTIEEWFVAEEKFVVNTQNFLSKINFGSEKVCKKVKLNTKQAVIAEVLKQGAPLYVQTCKKRGENPNLVKQ